MSQSERRDDYIWRHEVALLRLLIEKLSESDASKVRAILLDALRKSVDRETKGE